MNNKKNCNKSFVDKGYTANLYSWIPGCPDFSKKKLNNNRTNIIFSGTTGSKEQDK